MAPALFEVTNLRQDNAVDGAVSDYIHDDH
jgi:hypothetical protein